MLNSNKIAGYLFAVGLVLCLLQLWLPGWYLTGDGPCHLYNAGILRVMRGGGAEVAFYSRFYEVSHNPDPNWMSHILLSVLLGWAPAAVAEKVLLSLYVVVFTTGFARLLRRLDGAGYYWALIPFVFVFHYVLAKGFYNFSIGVGLLFWTVDTWLGLVEKWSPWRLTGFLLLVCLTFFAHPVDFAFAAACCFFLSFGKGAMRRIAWLGACLLPCALLLLKFASGHAHEGVFRLHLARYKLLEFCDFNCLVNVTSAEVLPVFIVCVLIIALLVYAVMNRWRQGVRWQRYDGLLVTMLLALLAYLFFPDKLFGGSLFVVRAQYLWGVFAVCCIGHMLPAGRIKDVAGAIFFLCFVWLSIPRTICRMKAANGVADIVSAAGYIKPNSVVLPLDFAPSGLDTGGKVIADRNWLFGHSWQYMGLMKPMILLDNYEANTGYFPLNWKDPVNPYHYLCSAGAMEAQPPHASIDSYTHATGVTVDYVLLWCYDEKWQSDEGFNKLWQEIRASYHIVYRSVTGRTVLYARN